MFFKERSVLSDSGHRYVFGPASAERVRITDRVEFLLDAMDAAPDARTANLRYEQIKMLWRQSAELRVAAEFEFFNETVMSRLTRPIVLRQEPNGKWSVGRRA